MTHLGSLPKTITLSPPSPIKGEEKKRTKISGREIEKILFSLQYQIISYY